MADSSSGNIPEIMILSDDDEETAKAKPPKPTPSTTTPAIPIPVPLEDLTVEAVIPAKPEAIKEEPVKKVDTPTVPTPRDEPEPMQVDDDSDLELIEELPAQKKTVITEVGKAALTEVESAIETEVAKKVDQSAPKEERKMPEDTLSPPVVTETPDFDMASPPAVKRTPEVVTSSTPVVTKTPDVVKADTKSEEMEVETAKPVDVKPGKSLPAKVLPKALPKIEKVRKKNCCNMDCSMTSNQFSEADSLTKNFFEVKNLEVICHVCHSCARSVDLYRQKCLDMLELEQPIVNAIQYLPSKNMVVLDDSDEENDAEDEEDKEMFDIDCDLLDTITKEIEQKYKLDRQDEKCLRAIKSHTVSINDTFDELDAGIANCHSILSEVQESIFGPWRPQATVIGEFDCEISKSISPAVTVSHKKKGAVAMKKVTQVQTSSQTPEVIAEVPAPGPDASQSMRNVNIPPKGPLRNTPIVIGDTVFGMKSGLYHEWLRAKVVEIAMKNGEAVYRVKFIKSTVPMKSLTARQISYGEPGKFQFEVGCRVIALFHNAEETGPSKNLFYAGIIAEDVKVTNNYRYLIFFDDGCTQYVPHEQVRLVVKRSPNIWEDCHVDIKDFIKNYLDMYPERPMVRLSVNQKVKTEWNTRWWLTKVKEVDCSLVLIYFEADNRTEWIYRGSQRLAPLYCEMQKKQNQKNTKGHVRLHRGLASNANRKNHPEIEYPRMLDDDDERQKVSRSVAKKSTVSRPFNQVPSLPERRENYGETIVQSLGTGKWDKVFVNHQCTARCVNESENTYKEGDKVNCNPMVIPLNQGWGRETASFRNTKLQVFYRGPCGRRIRSMQELMRYLRTTKSTLPADLFSFDFNMKLDITFRVDKPLYSIKDISYGSENVKIPCVNTINHTEYPMYVNYSTTRNPSAKTYISKEAGFLVCCDCTDDCQDKTKCACHKLTVEEAQILDPKQDPLKVGYNYRRLAFGGQQTTAIYECNAHCKCKSTCLNRVVQHKMKFQLQLFKTEKRGWGLRTLNDIPSGSFLCIYAGQIMTEQEGNEEGKQFGDEYLAELDYIEVLERCKEGYESDADDIEDADFDGSKAQQEEESDDSQEGDMTGQASEDKDFMSSLSRVKISEEEDKKMTLRRREKEKNNAAAETIEVEDDVEMQQGEVKAPKGFKSDKDVSVRYHFDHNDEIYVMDAKSIGNLGRYFNHSCEPNVIVQNVFVDTHDLRFPWVAFFTKKHVPAGSELCWDYNYEIGSLPDRRLDCYCESSHCRGRLL